MPVRAPPAWREVPDPLLAALIDRVSARTPSEPIGGSNKTATVKKRLARATELDVPAILDYALTEMRTFPRAYAAAVQLAGKVPPDPRIAAALVAIIEDPPFVELKQNAQGALQGDVVEALHAIDDPRYHALLRDASARLEERRRYIRRYKGALDGLAKIAKQLADSEPPVLAGLAKIAKEIDAALATPKQRARTSEAGELLAAIYANPADTSLRQIYADVLQDAGDPRGEFIGLQCGRADDAPPSKRERQLLKQYERQWLGDIEPIIRKRGVVFRRGFPACVVEGMKYTKHEPLFASPVWSTVEEVELETWTGCAETFLCDPRWQVLRKIYGLYHSTFEALAGKTLPWTTLGIRYPRPQNWALAAKVLPDLVDIDLAHNCTTPLDHLRAIAQTPLARRVKRIRVAAHANVARLVAAMPPGAALELVYAYTFPGDPEGASVVIAGTHATLVCYGQLVKVGYAAAILRELPSLETVELRAPAKARVDEATWGPLAEHLAGRGIALQRP